MSRLTITEWLHGQLLPYVREGNYCVDATAGKGNDTLFLCENMKPEGKVVAFDIQKEALEATASLLTKKGYEEPKVQLILDGHEHMAEYVKAGMVDVVMFNLGYLPGGDHHVATAPETTLVAIEQGLSMLKQGGVMGICIYSGGDSGFSERDAVLSYIEALDAKKYTAIVSRFYNKPNHPPIPVVIRKEEG